MRWLREPLLQFLLIGATLFAANAWFDPERGGAEAPKQIRLTPDDIYAMGAFFQSQWRRLPTQEEFALSLIHI